MKSATATVNRECQGRRKLDGSGEIVYSAIAAKANPYIVDQAIARLEQKKRSRGSPLILQAS